MRCTPSRACSAWRARSDAPAPPSGAASSRSTAPAPGPATPRRWSRWARAARRSFGPRPLSEETGCEVWLKFEGANPTGSFKDRGMTLAISKAVEEGAKAVVCASTGNTSASAAAYAAKAGLTCAVLVPEGQVALGKMAQTPCTARGSSRSRATSTPRSSWPGPGRALPGDAGEHREPVPPPGPEDGGVRGLRRARARARPALPPRGQRRQHLEPLDRLLGVPRRRR